MHDSSTYDPSPVHAVCPSLLGAHSCRVLIGTCGFCARSGGLQAVEVATEAARLAESLSLLLAVAQAKLLLAEIRLVLDDSTAARRDLQAATPRLLAHGSLEDKVRIWQSCHFCDFFLGGGLNGISLPPVLLSHWPCHRNASCEAGQHSGLSDATAIALSADVLHGPGGPGRPRRLVMHGHMGGSSH